MDKTGLHQPVGEKNFHPARGSDIFYRTSWRNVDVYNVFMVLHYIGAVINSSELPECTGYLHYNCYALYPYEFTDKFNITSRHALCYILTVGSMVP
jgi:hypothetical protein